MNNTLVALLLSLLTTSALAQFTGPSGSSTNTVAEARQVPPETYVTVIGYILAHERENYYTFKDATGQIRVEIEAPVWQNRRISPETKVRLFAESDVGLRGRYLWVESLQVID